MAATRRRSRLARLLDALEPRIFLAAHTWTGAAGSLWSNPANWAENAAPTAGEANVDLTFGPGAQNLTNTNDVTGLTISSITLTGTGYNVGGSSITLAGSITSAGATNNTLALPLALSTNAAIATGNATAAAVLHLAGAISGTAGINKTGLGVLFLDTANSYSGVTAVAAGTLAVTNNAALGTGDSTSFTGTTVLSGASLDLGAGLAIGNEYLTLSGTGDAGLGALSTGGSVTYAGPINIAATTTLNVSAPDVLTLSGTLTGSSDLTKIGSGTLILAGCGTYSGTLNVRGEVLVDGTYASANISVSSFSLGTLAGNGTVNHVSSVGGIVQAGGNATSLAAPGMLNIAGGLTLDANSFVQAVLGGTVAGTDYDQLNVTGTVNLAGAGLSVSLAAGANPGPGSAFVLINNDSNDAVVGTFAGLPEGAAVSLGGAVYTISYVGLTGNDVVLTQNGSPSINATATTLSAAPNPAQVNQSVTLTANVSSSGGTPTGNVTFKNGTNTLGTATLNGSGLAQLTLSTLPQGTDPLLAIYNGAATFATSTSSTYNITINPDVTAPTAALVVHDFSGAGTIGQVQITFSDISGVDATTLTTPVVVSGPGGFSANATLVATQPAGNATSITATYQFTAPGGSWDLADEGAYTVTLAANAVADIYGNKLAGGVLGKEYYSNNPLFSERYYLTSYADVASAVAGGGLASGYAHYLAWGQQEGRSPSRYFNEQYYRQRYADVDQAVRAGALKSGFEHFALYGAREGRQPSFYFDQVYYLSRYQDVAGVVQAGGINSALEHFMAYGQYESRSPSVYFSGSYYVSRYGASIVSGQVLPPLEHFLAYGLSQGRDPISIYDESYYLGRYTDVANAVSLGAFKSGYEHYVLYGQYENRRPSSDFDPVYYLNRYPDVAAAVNSGAIPSAFVHYRWYGQAEGRVAHA